MGLRVDLPRVRIRLVHSFIPQSALLLDAGDVNLSSNPPISYFKHLQRRLERSVNSISFRCSYFPSKYDPQFTVEGPRLLLQIMSLQGKVYAITGGASGIGLATAKILSRRDAIVCIADVDPATMESATSYFTEQKVPFTVTRVDVSQRDQVEGWLDSIVDKYGRLDGAANVAGVIGKHHGIRPVAELEDDEWHKIIAVNLTGTMYCLRAELRRVVDGGSIVNVASIHGIKGTCS